jgi:hypothetical protein
LLILKVVKVFAVEPVAICGDASRDKILGVAVRTQPLEAWQFIVEGSGSTPGS